MDYVIFSLIILSYPFSLPITLLHQSPFVYLSTAAPSTALHSPAVHFSIILLVNSCSAAHQLYMANGLQ